ncbi:MAG: hypothetical protein MZW92_49285 [Comamonadaceae bacterium]|nr:hypothetical protein [Comamonadaceae bacterium]
MAFWNSSATASVIGIDGAGTVDLDDFRLGLGDTGNEQEGGNYRDQGFADAHWVFLSFLVVILSREC